MNYILCSISSVAATIASAATLCHLARFKERTWDDYYPNLRQFDWEEARFLFDHEQEGRLTGFRNSRQFRRDQRSRLDLALELLLRAYHDSRLSREWCLTEWFDMNHHHLEYEPAVVDAMRTLRKETAKFRRMALFDLAYMWLLSLTRFDDLRFMPVPSVVARRKVFGEDLLQAYDRVRHAAANFARLAYDDEKAELILARM